MDRLSGKYAIVTGGGQGIGAAIVKRFIAEGAAGVAIWDYNEELAQKTAAEIGGNIIAIKCDISNEEMVKTAKAGLEGKVKANVKEVKNEVVKASAKAEKKATKKEEKTEVKEEKKVAKKATAKKETAEKKPAAKKTTKKEAK